MSEISRQHGAPSWIGHFGPDMPAARQFYRQVLGWQVADMPMQDGSVYPGIMIGEQPVGGFSPVPEPEGHWLVYITVDDVDRRFKAALAEGAKAVSEPVSVPGVGRMATLCDPFGARFALITYE